MYILKIRQNNKEESSSEQQNIIIIIIVRKRCHCLQDLQRLFTANNATLEHFNDYLILLDSTN